MTILTAMFFFLNFLAATQDIAVDGWALTMLQRHNVGYASTCNSVGQTAGYFLGYVFFMGLESYGLVTLASFLQVILASHWSILLILSSHWSSHWSILIILASHWSMFMLQIILPWIISRYTAGPRPMDVFVKAIPVRLVLCLVMAGGVYITPTFKLSDGSFPLSYYGLLIFVYGIYQVEAPYEKPEV